ncbi:HNH endonuclease [Bradyrhizobium diazoefficiens]|uniref:HNH endonuclease n=1 Tax=Bradyrhizobium diazoefficiens TaxID=1355477 RepID=UPI00190CF7B5|nr:HNH endonuclease [Bradyrhizobium diazoefficiens]QQO14990.1 HNH endonuclease [Bradyrhizobium diazoefficiens]
MSKAVLTTKVMPGYKDLPEVRYHFPRTYLNQIRQAVGDHVLYYEPRRTTVELSSFGGRQSYFGVARVVGLIEDRDQADHYYALVDDYLDFDRPVPFAEGSRYYESALRKADGSTNKGAFGRAVRLIPDAEFDQILKAGFAPILGEETPRHQPSQFEISEPNIAFERPIVEMTVSRPFRERSFMYNVRAAYENRCAMTGLRLINGGGRPEVQAAHIQPVAEKGPDSVRNGLALSGTVHWMFDRGLISIGDDYKILTAESHVPDDALRLLNQSRMINLPADPAFYPNALFLKFHRDKIFKG